MDKQSKPLTKGYHDLLFRIIISLVAAHIIVVYGEKESIFQLLLLWDYYRSVLLSAVIAFSLVSMVYLVTVKLDVRFDWKKMPAIRIGLQTLLGLMLPSFLAFILAAIYFRLYDIDIFVTRYLQYDFLVITGMVLLLNLYYLAYYFYLQMKQAEELVLAKASANSEYHIPLEKAARKVITVTRGAKNIPLPVEQISYVYHAEPYNVIRTSDREDFLVTYSLDLLQQQLPAQQFFRVNRQMLVNMNACHHFENIEHQKLKLHVQPETSEPVIISQKRAKEFKEWIAG